MPAWGAGLIVTGFVAAVVGDRRGRELEAGGFASRCSAAGTS